MDRTTAESPIPVDATTGRAPAEEVGERTRRDPTDEELDQYIRVRLALIGVDLSVLPEEDSSAPADQLRIFRSVRSFLRNTVPALSDYPLDPQEAPPSMYPAHLPAIALRGPGETGPMVGPGASAASGDER